MKTTCAVTGAFGYSGKYIAARLLAAGGDVITLTNSAHRPDPFQGRVSVHPFQFDQPDQLAETLRGVQTLINTYWVRFNHRHFTQAEAVRNTLALFAAARQAGVRRVVHVSITNPSAESPLEYFRHKARLEQALVQSGLSYAILRPAVLFGHEDILINNLAWALRRLPVFGVFGDGRYRLQPIYVEDRAELAVAQADREDNVILNAIGPETFTYRELIATIGRLIGHARPTVSVPPFMGYCAARLLGALTHDVLLTRDEIRGLMAGLLCVDTPPTGHTKLTDWIRQNAETLGIRYASELARRQPARVSR
jgi:uncharacterized protein YbjT (DUF2867 family)